MKVPVHDPEEYPRDNGDLLELLATITARINELESERREQLTPNTAVAKTMEIEKRALEEAKEHLLFAKNAKERDNV